VLREPSTSVLKYPRTPAPDSQNQPPGASLANLNKADVAFYPGRFDVTVFDILHVCLDVTSDEATIANLSVSVGDDVFVSAQPS
jgi:hypothetical protein